MFLLFKMKYVIDEGCLFDYWHMLLLFYLNAWMNLLIANVIYLLFKLLFF